MAFQSKGFSHIAVSEEEDDLVIQAGAYDRGSNEDSACDTGADAGAERDVAGDCPPAAEPEEAFQSHADDASGKAESQTAKKPDEARMGTSLEDLEDAKMGTLQKVIVAVAAAAIVAFAVYYLCFM